MIICVRIIMEGIVEMNSIKNVLIVGAHFDDCELAAAGSAAKWVKEGKRVYKLTLTDNVTNFIQTNRHVSYDSSVKESARACEQLGVIELTEFIPEACNNLCYNTEVMQRVEGLIYKYDIDTLIYHYSQDSNQDHVEASRICSTAGRRCKNLLMYQSNGYIVESPINPTFYVDITNTIELKKKALTQYGGEHNVNGHLFEMCINRNAVYGYSCGTVYAEAFEIVKMIY